MNLTINSSNNIQKYRKTCFNGKKNTSFGKIPPLIHDRYFSIFESDKIKVISYHTPVKLGEALHDIINMKELDSGIVGHKASVKQFLCDLPEKIKSIQVKGLNGYGTSAIAFDMTDDRILKITQGNHFRLNRPHMDFDVPVYESGHVKDTYYYIQEKLYQHNLPEQFTKMVVDRIRQAGLKVKDIDDYDWASHQIGLSKEGKLYLLDSECAQYKSVFHALWDKLTRAVKK